jgi:hypothetical protein
VSRRRPAQAIVAAVLTVAAASSCSADRVPVPQPTSEATLAAAAAPANCDGSSGQPLLAALFADLGRGEAPPVATFFSAPNNFLRWEDPTTGTDITAGFGADTSTYTLDALQSHLDALALDGVDGTITHFAIDGNPDGDASRDGGGLFRFDLRARWHGNDSEASEGGIGVIDCATGKLKEVVIAG